MCYRHYFRVRTYGTPGPHHLTCSHCGEQFTHDWISAKYCGAACHNQVKIARRKAAGMPSGGKRSLDQTHAHNHKRRSAKYGAGYECFPASEIYERDGWRCGICTKRVRPSRFKRDPDGPSLDHMIPLSLGGTHSRANVRLTHLRCNNARGVRGDVQLLLLG